MITQIAKYAAVVVLLGAVVWRSNSLYEILVQFVVCVGALMVVRQAILARSYFMTVVFCAVALVFNPVAPIAFSGKTSLLLQLFSVSMFVVSLLTLKSGMTPRLSMPSITDRTPGSESL